MHRHSAASAAALASVLHAAAPLARAEVAAAPGAVRLEADEVLRRALATSTAARAARARRDEVSAQRRSVRGQLLPGVTVSDEAQRWNSTFEIPFPGAPAPIVAREQSTNTFVAAAGQPILGLLHGGSDLAALGSATGAAEADVRATEAAVREAVSSELLRLFEARALGDIARASVGQLTEQLQVTRARVQAGVLTKADSLRIETALANAKQQELQAAAQEDSERAGLLVAIGEMPDATGIDFAEPALPEPSQEPELGAAVRGALSRRAEVESARLTEESAGLRARARTFELLPEVNAEAAWIHATGQVFQPVDSGFIGVKLEWPIWDWGAKWYARSAAVAQADAAAAQRKEVRDRVSVEVAARLAATRASASAVGVAQTGIASAEEAYRVMQELVKAGSATTTDLLDAQSALTTARSNLARARYAYALSRVALARALGEA